MTLNANMTALLLMLQKRHKVAIVGKSWHVDDAVTFWPEDGRWERHKSKGSAKGTLRGRAESLFEQIEKLLVV